MQGHSADDGDAARPRRGRDHRGVRDPCPARLHLRSRRGDAGAAPAAGGRRRGLRGRLSRHRHRRVGLRPRPGGPRRGGCLHLRRGDRAARLAGGQAGTTPTAAALPRRGGSLRLPHRRQQRRVDRERARRRAPRHRLVQVDGLGEVTRFHAVLAVRPRRRDRASTRRRSASRCGNCSTTRAGSGRATS